jgi:hypothetical protein
MRERHFPRQCRSCNAPMARQEDACWSCAATWDYRSARRSGWRDVDRWSNEGGSLAAEESQRVGARIAAVQ